MRWTRDSGQVTTRCHPRSYANIVEQMENPLIDLIKSNRDRLYSDLTDPDEVARYDMFAQLASKGTTGYAAFKRSFGMSQVLETIVATEFRGAILSFSTDRSTGFSQPEPAGIERLITPLCTCIRVENDQLLTSAVLETYLGPISGQQVLAGHIERGDGQQIDCACGTCE